MMLKGFYWGDTANHARKMTPSASDGEMSFIPGDNYLRKLPPADAHPRECIFEVPDWLYNKDSKLQRYAQV